MLEAGEIVAALAAAVLGGVVLGLLLWVADLLR